MTRLHGAIAVAMAATLVLLSSDARADYSDDFESYTLGNINGQGPWVDFGGALTPDVSNALALSGTQSLALSTNVGGGYGSDVYIGNLNGAPVTSGLWSLSFSTYVPGNFDGEAIFYESQGPMPTTFERGARVRLNNLAGAASFDVESTPDSAPLVFDQWADIEMLIDLDNNTLDISYNGSPVHSGTWDNDNPGSPSLGGVNWWAQGGAAQGTVYIDDLSLTQVVPEPSTIALGVLGLIGLAMCRKQR